MTFETGKLYAVKHTTKYPLFFKPLEKSFWLDLTCVDALLCLGYVQVAYGWSRTNIPLFLFSGHKGTVGDETLLKNEMQEVYCDI